MSEGGMLTEWGVKGGVEVGREEGREEGREGGRGREGERERGRKEGREGGREGEREGEREREREREGEGERKRGIFNLIKIKGRSQCHTSVDSSSTCSVGSRRPARCCFSSRYLTID